MANGRVKASPLAKRLAEERGLSLGLIPGSGEGGRIVKRDVEAFVGGGASAANAVERFTEVGVSQMRKTIARRLAESKFTAPRFYLSLTIDMDAAMVARKAINDRGPHRVSFNDMVVKAVAMALKNHPAVNSSWLEDRIRYNEHVHIGVAVAVEDGLLVPVVRHANVKSFGEIGVEVREFAQKAKDKKLQPSDWEGNTFTISNLGMFGIDEFTAIINPPDACILAVEWNSSGACGTRRCRGARPHHEGDPELRPPCGGWSDRRSLLERSQAKLGESRPDVGLTGEGT